MKPNVIRPENGKNVYRRKDLTEGNVTVEYLRSLEKRMTGERSNLSSVNVNVNHAVQERRFTYQNEQNNAPQIVYKNNYTLVRGPPILHTFTKPIQVTSCVQNTRPSISY